MKEKSNLENLKKDYKKIQKKYDLPNFDELNKDFQIEKVAETETDFLIREIRKFMADKFSNYLRFIEAILNPVNAPMFIFSIIKSIGIEEKKKLTDIYGKLSKTELFYVALSYFQYMNPDKPMDEAEFQNFVKLDVENWEPVV